MKGPIYDEFFDGFTQKKSRGLNDSIKKEQGPGSRVKHRLKNKENEGKIYDEFFDAFTQKNREV